MKWVVTYHTTMVLQSKDYSIIYDTCSVSYTPVVSVSFRGYTAMHDLVFTIQKVTTVMGVCCGLFGMLMILIGTLMAFIGETL